MASEQETTPSDEPAPPPAQGAPMFANEADEVKDLLLRHSTEEACWVVVRGRVLDVTSFVARHPGGKRELLDRAGTDATKMFESIPIHTSPYGSGLDMLKKYDIGAFEGDVAALRAAARR